MAVGKKSTHKNAARSRQLIKQAFAQLLNEKDMSKITVTDIVDRAGISRGTFYAHYLDVYDLHIAIQNNVVESVNDAFDAVGIDSIIRDPSVIIRMGLQFLEKNKEYYKLFTSSKDGENLIRRLVAIIYDKYTERIGELTTQNNLRAVSYYLTYTLGGIRSVILDWMNSGSPISAAECADTVIAFASASRPAILEEIVAKLPAEE